MSRNEQKLIGLAEDRNGSLLIWCEKHLKLRFTDGRIKFYYFLSRSEI